MRSRYVNFLVAVLILSACAPATVASTEAPAGTDTNVATATMVPPTETPDPSKTPRPQNALIAQAESLGATEIVIHESGTRALLATPSGLYELNSAGGIVLLDHSSDTQNPGYSGEYMYWFTNQGKMACYGDGLPDHRSCFDEGEVFGGYAKFTNSEFFVMRNTLYADGDNIEEGALSGKQEVINSLVGNTTPDFPLVAVVEQATPEDTVIRVYDGEIFEELTPWRLVGSGPVWAGNNLYFVGTNGVHRASDFWGGISVELECAGTEIRDLVLSPEQNITYITISGDVYTCSSSELQATQLGKATELIGFWGPELIVLNSQGELEAISIPQ